MDQQLYFVQNNTAIFQSGDIRRAASELLDAGVQLRDWNISNISIKKFWGGFVNYKFLFVNIQYRG